MIHGSSEGRFRITYAPGGLTRAEIESVGFQFMEWSEAEIKYSPHQCQEGWNQTGGEEFYFIGHPAKDFGADPVYSDTVGLNSSIITP